MAQTEAERTYAGVVIPVKVLADMEDVKLKLDAAQTRLDRFKIHFGIVKKDYIVWSRTISRNLTLIFTLMEQTAFVQRAQQALQVYTLATTINQLRIRAGKQIGLGVASLGLHLPVEAGLHFAKATLFSSQAILLAAVQVKAFQGQVRAENAVAAIARVRQWSDV